MCLLKGTVSRDFLLLVFSWISFPQASDYTIRPFRIFSKIRGDIRSSRFATGVIDTGKKMEKIFNQKNFNNFIWSPLGSRGNIYKIFAFKFTFRYLQPDIVPIICHWCQQHKGNWWQNLPRFRWYRWQICRRCRWYRRQFATGVIDTGGKFATGVVDTGGALDLRISPQLFEKFEMILRLSSGAWGKVIHEKNLKQKISCHCPFNIGTREMDGYSIRILIF